MTDRAIFTTCPHERRTILTRFHSSPAETEFLTRFLTRFCCPQQGFLVILRCSWTSHPVPSRRIDSPVLLTCTNWEKIQKIFTAIDTCARKSFRNVRVVMAMRCAHLIAVHRFHICGWDHVLVGAQRGALARLCVARPFINWKWSSLMSADRLNNKRVRRSSPPFWFRFRN